MVATERGSVTEGFSVMSTPDLIEEVRTQWKHQLRPMVESENGEAAQVFETALTAVLSRLFGIHETISSR